MRKQNTYLSSGDRCLSTRLLHFGVLRQLLSDDFRNSPPVCRRCRSARPGVRTTAVLEGGGMFSSGSAFNSSGGSVTLALPTDGLPSSSIAVSVPFNWDVANSRTTSAVSLTSFADTDSGTRFVSGFVSKNDISFV